MHFEGGTGASDVPVQPVSGMNFRGTIPDQAETRRIMIPVHFNQGKGSKVKRA